jgi:hypothetical protein
MAVIRQDPESLRRDLDTKLRTIILDLQMAGLTPEQIEKELRAAVGRASGGHSKGEAARRDETKRTLDDYGKKVGS